MKLTGNTILITGGGSGIGRGLAEAFHKLGNEVVIAGRREHVLQATAAANPGMSYVVMDTQDAASIAKATAQVMAEHPGLNVVINNAGVQRYIDFAKHYDDAKALEEINTNILGVMRVTSALLPQLRSQRDAVVVNVSSGLAFVPMARYPVYCASKAFVHSFSISLRHQLKATGVRVVELAPPWVESDLHATHPPEGNPEPAPGRGPMPLDAFIAAAIEELGSGKDELAVAGAKFMYGAAVGEGAGKAFLGMNG
jgi:uncharacterized oxidoreductase